MKLNGIILVSLLVIFSLSSCRVVRQGNVGVKRTLGKINENVLNEGARWYNPFVSTIIIVPVRTINMEVKLDLPSKEGLNVEAEISILYHVDRTRATEVIATIGGDYEQAMILPVFRASSADVTARFMAKDMHTGNRQGIENEIKNNMMQILEKRGFIIESVLMKSIKLPPNLYRAIEEKLEAEQLAQRMQFVLERERQEAERKKVEAEGIRDANRIIAEGLTPQIIQFQSLEVYRELSNSPNTKVIIGSGTTPLLIDPK
jgi:prohibitin 1